MLNPTSEEGAAMEKFFLKNITLDALHKKEISKESYLQIKSSSLTLTGALEIEKKYHIFIKNHKEFELEILTSTLNSSIHHMTAYGNILKTTLDLNARLMNLLSSARAYFDQTPKDVTRFIDKSKRTEDTVKSLIKSNKESNNSFRFIEELRNHSQHYGLPIHTLVIDMKKDNDTNNIAHSIDCKCQKDILLEDTRFKGALDQMPDDIDIIMHIREYASTLSDMHTYIRKEICEHAKLARKLITETISSFNEDFNYNAQHLEMYHIKSGIKIEKRNIFLHWDNERLELEKHNQSLGSMKRRYITSKLNS